MEINLEELKDSVYGWFYEGYARGIDSFLSEDDARVLYDCMAVINHAIKQGDVILISDVSNRP